jgi:hypothetical protein
VGAAIGRLLLRRRLLLGLQSALDHFHHLLVLIAVGPAGPELVMHAFQALLQIPLAPHADGHSRQPHAPGDRCLGLASPAGQNDLNALHDRMRQQPGLGESLQLLNSVLSQDLRRNRLASHDQAPQTALVPAAISRSVR